MHPQAKTPCSDSECSCALLNNSRMHDTRASRTDSVIFGQASYLKSSVTKSACASESMRLNLRYGSASQRGFALSPHALHVDDAIFPSAEKNGKSLKNSLLCMSCGKSANPSPTHTQRLSLFHLLTSTPNAARRFPSNWRRPEKSKITGSSTGTPHPWEANCATQSKFSALDRNISGKNITIQVSNPGRKNGRRIPFLSKNFNRDNRIIGNCTTTIQVCGAKHGVGLRHGGIEMIFAPLPIIW